MALCDVKKAMDKFEKCRESNQNFGTYDSEVSRVVCRIIAEAIRGKKPKVPDTYRGWQIYDLPNCENVATNLAIFMHHVVDAIHKCTVFESNEKEFKNYISNYILYDDLINL